MDGSAVPGSVTEWIAAAKAGDADAADRLFRAVYEELRSIAHRERRRGPARAAAETLDTTAIVHEAFLRLARPSEELAWENRAHLLGTAAVAMRRLLVDRARARNADKRGGGARMEALDTGAENILAADSAADDIEALEEGLQRLEVMDRRLAKVVELRFFGGLSEREAGQILGVDERTVRRDWSKAKAFLHAHLSPAPPASPASPASPATPAGRA
jgi:RNA polymerase sigma factor (TIGR02999 family)